MLKDRAQKSLALSLAASKGWLPQLEVEIAPGARLLKTKSLLTDIDVLAVAPHPFSGTSRCVFDCKSSARESAISRAFWLRGVMDRVHAQHGFVVLSDEAKIVLDHRMSAIEMSVTLLHGTDMTDLASSWGGSTTARAHISSVDTWEEFLRCGSDNKKLIEYKNFALSSFWTAKDPGERCRKILSRLRGIATELDPAKPAHMALFGDAVCLLLVTLSELTNKLLLLLLRTREREDFSNALLALLFGGHENLHAAQRLRQLAGRFGEEDGSTIFPELGRFEQLSREIVQAPLQALPAAVLAREMAFDRLFPAAQSDLYQSEITMDCPYAPKFVLMASDFLRRACKIPGEFSSSFGDQAANLMSQQLR